MKGVAATVPGKGGVVRRGRRQKGMAVKHERGGHGE